MDLFTKHFTKYHLFHAPHKWFLALLVSPIHAAEIHYKKKYRLNFVHARKLFIFDIALLASIFALIGAIVFWSAYDPTITKLVALDINVAPHSATNLDNKIRSGEYVTYTSAYANNSEISLISPSLSFQLPETFIIEKTEPAELFSEQTHSFSLPDIPPGAAGAVSVTGFFYGNVNQEYHVSAVLSYNQPKRSAAEQKRTVIITTIRESILQTKINAPQYILSHGTIPISVTIKNNGGHPIADIRLPFPQEKPFIFTLGTEAPAMGIVEKNEWRILDLQPNEEAVIHASLTTALDETSSQKTLSLTPIIFVKNTPLLQSSAARAFDVVRPNVELNAAWAGGAETIGAGKTASLNLKIQNSGATELKNLKISIPIENKIINIASLRGINHGLYKDNAFIITKDYAANLAALEPNEETTLTINIPIQEFISDGIDIGLSLKPKLSADVARVANAKYEIETASPNLKIGTNLFMNAQARYYTAEGDQLGRGPLPPIVGKETKYWGIITIQNTTSRVADLNFSAVLPTDIQWTGKSSVSRGNNLAYNPETKIVSWSMPSLNPRETIGLYLELLLTPMADHIGTTPILLKNIAISARDTYISTEVTKTIPMIDASIPADKIGRSKGFAVR